MATAARRFLRILLVVVAAVLAAVLLGAVPVSVGLLKGQLGAIVHGATGLQLRIDDPIILRLGANPSVATGGIRFGDPEGGWLAEIETLNGQLSLLSLLAGRVRIREAQGDGIRVDYCAPLPRLGNKSETAEPPQVIVDQLQMQRVLIHCKTPPASSNPIQATVSRMMVTAPDGEAMQLEADGTVSGVPYRLDVTGGELDRLLAGQTAYPVDVRLATALATMDGSARLSRPLAIDAQFGVDVADLQSLLRLFDITVPDVGALRLGAFIQSDFAQTDLQVRTGQLGSSRFGFESTIDTSGGRPQVGLTGRFQHLDLAPFVADGPPGGEVEPGPGLSDASLEPVLSALKALNAELDLTIREISGLPVDITAAEASVSLAQGNASARLDHASVFGGRLSGSGNFDSSVPCPALKLSLSAEKVDLESLSTVLPEKLAMAGGIQKVDIESASCGSRIYEHRDTVRARAELLEGRFRVNNSVVPVVVESLAATVEPDQPSMVRFAGSLAGVAVDARLTAGSLDALLHDDAWPIELDVESAARHLRLRGQATGALEDPVLDGVLELDVPGIATPRRTASGHPAAELPLRATAEMHLDRENIVADEIAVSLGGSGLGGRVAWRYADRPGAVNVRLRAARLDLPEIASWFPHTDNEPGPRGAGARPKGGRRWTGVVLPSIDLDLRLDAVQAHQLDLQDVRIEGRASNGVIDNASISLVAEEDVYLSGSINLDLSRVPANASLRVSADNLDIGRLASRLDVAKELRMLADGLELHVDAEGGSPRELVMNSKIEAELRGFQWRVPQSLLGDTGHAGQDLEISLESLRLTTAPDLPTTWSSAGRFDGIQVDLHAQSPSLVDTFGNGGEFPLHLVLAANDNVAMLEATVDQAAQGGLKARARISGAVIERSGRSLDRLAGPLPDYEFSTTALITAQHLSLPDLRMQQGASAVNGSVTIIGGDRREIEVALNASSLQTDDLLYWSRDFRHALSNGTSAGEDDEVSDTEDSYSSEPVPNGRGVLPIISDFIATLQARNDLAMSLTVDDLNAGDSPLGSAELQLHIDENEFRLAPFRISLPGGGVHASYSARVVDGRLEADLAASADALSYAGLLRLADPDSEAQGLLFLDTRIHATADMEAGKAPLALLIENANGHFSVAAWPENIEAGVLDLWSANLVLALLPAPSSQKAARLNCLASNFEIRDGLMKSTASLLDTTDTIIRGRGTIDLGREQLDLLVWPQAKREKFLSVSTPVTVTGSFQDFRVGVKPAGFIGTIIRWYTSLIYVPFKWLTGERFAADGTSTCFDAMGWDLGPELDAYFKRRDFSAPPVIDQQ